MGYFKRGYELDLTNYGATFIGEAHIEGAVLYGIGEYLRRHLQDRQYGGVGLRLNEDPGGVAHGELWEIPDEKTWTWLDMIEQNGRVYTRKVVKVQRTDCGEAGEGVVPYDAWVYEHNFEKFPKENRIVGGRF